MDDYVKTDFRTRVALGLLSATQAAKMTDCPTVQFKCNSHGVDTDPALSSDWLEVAKEKQLGVAMCSHNVVLAAISTPMNENSSLIRALLYCILSDTSFRVYTRVTVGANGVLEFIKFMLGYTTSPANCSSTPRRSFRKCTGRNPRQLHPQRMSRLLR